MNSNELFSLALGLESPWKISNLELSPPTDKQLGALHIYLDFSKGSKFKDVTGVLCPVHDTHNMEWQHLNFFQHSCYLHARVPRISTTTGEVVTVQVPWARAGSGFTLLFEAFSML
jgi:transposase